MKELENSPAIFETFANSFCRDAVDTSIQAIKESVANFRDSTENMSIDDLNASLATNLKGRLDGLTENVSDYVKNAIYECTTDFRKRVDDIVLVYKSQGNNIQLPTLNVPHISMGEINIDSILNDIAKSLADDTQSGNMAGGGLAGAAGGALIGSVIPVIGTLTGALIGGALGIFSGGSDRPTAEQEKAKKRATADRKKIADLIEKKWDNIQKDVSETIFNNVNSNDDVKEAVRSATSNYLTDYKESLKDARILID